MESMRNLHRSLPGATSRHKKKTLTPPEDLLQSFKSAALSVTSLYKRAAEELSAERQVGYQDAIYDLLSFLDKENIGLETGEGWRVRQWATERQDTGPDTSDEDEEKEEERDEAQHGPEEDTAQTAEPVMVSEASKEQTAEDSTAEPGERIPMHPIPMQPPRMETFTFQAPHPFPSDEMESSQTPVTRATSAQARQAASPRASRRFHQPSRTGLRQRLGNGAGSKRKVQLNEFFDLGSLNFGKDSTAGGPKRPRPF